MDKLMNIDQMHIESVNIKLNQQNAIYGALGAALWSIPISILWFFAFHYQPDFGVMMLLPSGIMIGFAVRYHGKGMKRLFSFIALIAYTWLALFAYGANIVLEGTIWAILLFGIYAAGAGSAIYLAQRAIPFEEHRAHTQLTSMNTHPTAKAIKNRWFVAFPILILSLFVTSILSGISLTLIDEYRKTGQIEARKKALERIEKKQEIDLSPTSLAARTNEEILRYSYAYYSGLLFDNRGKTTRSFPRSKYKAETLLKYLMNERKNTRALYILGILLQEQKGSALIQSAAEQGDDFAKIHANVLYGCQVDQKSATTLLNKQRVLSQNLNIQDEIASILYIGFPTICSDFEKPEYLPIYVLNYED